MKSIIVNVMPEETRIAVKENNRLTSLELERPRHSHLVGNITDFLTLGNFSPIFIHFPASNLQPWPLEMGRHHRQSIYHDGNPLSAAP